MRISGLVVATLFFLSSLALAQHSSSSSGSSGGGGSHNNSSGGSPSSGSSGGGSQSSSSSSSSGGHSSGGGGSVSHGSSSHGSSARGSSSTSGSAVSPAHGLRSTEAKTQRSIREANSGLREPSARPEKRGFFSFLRHPFRKPEPKPVADLRKPVCLRGPCQICPNGQAKTGGCGVGTVVPQRIHHGCSGYAVWSGSPCVLQTHYLDGCSGLRTMLERQAQQMQAADSIRQSACTAGASAECSEASASWQSEQNLHQSLQQRYQQCRLQGGYSARLRGFGPANGSPNLFDSLRFEAEY